MKTQNEAFEALKSTLKELETLTKSWGAESEEMEKALGDEMPPEEQVPEAAPPAAEGEPAGSPDADNAAPEMEPQSEGEVEEAAPEDEYAQIAAEAAELDDEQLDMMLHALMSEKDSRMAQDGAPEEEGQEEAPAEAPAPAPAPAEDEQQALQMSMKQEFKQLNKSRDAQMNTLQKSVVTLTNEIERLKKAAQRPTTKPTANNKVEVMEKSVQAPKRLSKNETIDYLLGQMRAKNTAVDSRDVAMVNACRSEDDLNYAFDTLARKGLEIPSKK